MGDPGAGKKSRPSLQLELAPGASREPTLPKANMPPPSDSSVKSTKALAAGLEDSAADCSAPCNKEIKGSDAMEGASAPGSTDGSATDNDSLAPLNDDRLFSRGFWRELVAFLVRLLGRLEPGGGWPVLRRGGEGVSRLGATSRLPLPFMYERSPHCMAARPCRAPAS